MSQPDYYNEIDPYAAQWLRNLIAAGYLPAGDVDERSIEDVKADDLRPYRRCHFFAGIGGWALALRLAGWDDSLRCWTGSCPCQPFSSAGKGDGFVDERHLWPAFHHLIAQCQPPVVFGEQVASKDADPWIDLVSTDMEALGYAFGAVPFPAASVGAPHIRDRLYWVADADQSRLQGHGKPEHVDVSTQREIEERRNDSGFVASSFWDWPRDQGADGNFRFLPTNFVKTVDGLPKRMGEVRAYGNAIVIPQAVEFIKAVMECQP